MGVPPENESMFFDHFDGFIKETRLVVKMSSIGIFRLLVYSKCSVRCRFLFNQKLSNFPKRGQLSRNFPFKDSRKSEKIIKFPKSELFNRKFSKFWEENRQNQIGRQFPADDFRKFGYFTFPNLKTLLTTSFHV